MERTLCLVKPNATAKNHIGEIIARFEKKGLAVRGLKMLRLTKTQAEAFYAVHQGKSFFPELVNFMTSGTIVAMLLEGDNAVKVARETMGATDPSKAAEGTIRKDFADSMTANAVHGSDSPENAAIEGAFFFSKAEVTLL